MSTLDFKGKSIIYAHHLAVASRPLEVNAQKSLPPRRARSPKPSLDDNLIIHGDNLHALKALMPRYAGKVNCIYIDPPYNTGNEKWIYNDNVNSPMMKEWLKNNGPVDGEDLERHDKWLCMMWPRLQLLRELLAEDGVIFVSIDDNEQHNLRMAMDEIFGEDNFVGNIIVKSNPGGRDYGGIARTHEYILCYGKSTDAELNVEEDVNKEFPMSDGIGGFEPRELRNRNIRFNSENRPNLYYPFYINTDRKDENGLYEVSLARRKGWKRLYPMQSGGVDTVWRWGKEKVESNINVNVAAKDKQGGGYQIIEKYRSRKKRVRSIMDETEVRNEYGTHTIKAIFDGRAVFDYAKSDFLISKIINLGADKDAVILDSFAGSGTTAHAVLALNREDGGNRKFILVECGDYADKVTAERVRRVIKGVSGSNNESLKRGLSGSFTYCTLGDEISIEKLLAGRKLPSYETLARHVFWTATGRSADKINTKTVRGKDGLFYEDKDSLYYLVYEPTAAFLRGVASALNSDRAERIAKQVRKRRKKAIVFATHKFMGQKELAEMGIVFCGLPYCV